MDSLQLFSDFPYVSSKNQGPLSLREDGILFISINDFLRAKQHSFYEWTSSSGKELTDDLDLFCSNITHNVIYIVFDSVLPGALINSKRRENYEDALNSRDTLDLHVGTTFMNSVSNCVHYWSRCKVKRDKNVKVIISDHTVPGSAYSKVMDFIRSQRSLPNHNPNTQYIITGETCEAFRVSLVSHEKYIILISNIQFKDRTLSYDLIHVNIIIENLVFFCNNISNIMPLGGEPVNIDRLTDDLVLLTLLVDGDAIPSLEIPSTLSLVAISPTADTSHSSTHFVNIEMMLHCYKLHLADGGEYLSHLGVVKFDALGHFLLVLGDLVERVASGVNVYIPSITGFASDIDTSFSFGPQGSHDLHPTNHINLAPSHSSHSTDSYSHNSRTKLTETPTDLPISRLDRLMSGHISLSSRSLANLNAEIGDNEYNTATIRVVDDSDDVFASSSSSIRAIFGESRGRGPIHPRSSSRRPDSRNGHNKTLSLSTFSPIDSTIQTVAEHPFEISGADESQSGLHSHLHSHYAVGFAKTKTFTAPNVPLPAPPQARHNRNYSLGHPSHNIVIGTSPLSPPVTSPLSSLLESGYGGVESPSLSHSQPRSSPDTFPLPFPAFRASHESTESDSPGPNSESDRNGFQGSGIYGSGHSKISPHSIYSPTPNSSQPLSATCSPVYSPLYPSSLSTKPSHSNKIKEPSHSNKIKVVDIVEVCLSYIQGLLWNYKYYYIGVIDWTWSYPHHRAPSIPDLVAVLLRNPERTLHKKHKNLKSLDFSSFPKFTTIHSHRFNFTRGRPIKPFEYLLAILPPSHANLLPTEYFELVTDLVTSETSDDPSSNPFISLQTVLNSNKLYQHYAQPRPYRRDAQLNSSTGGKAVIVNPLSLPRIDITNFFHKLSITASLSHTNNTLYSLSTLMVVHDPSVTSEYHYNAGFVAPHIMTKTVSNTPSISPLPSSHPHYYPGAIDVCVAAKELESDPFRVNGLLYVPPYAANSSNSAPNTLTSQNSQSVILHPNHTPEMPNITKSETRMYLYMSPVILSGAQSHPVIEDPSLERFNHVTARLFDNIPPIEHPTSLPLVSEADLDSANAIDRISLGLIYSGDDGEGPNEMMWHEGRYLPVRHTGRVDYCGVRPNYIGTTSAFHPSLGKLFGFTDVSDSQLFIDIRWRYELLLSRIEVNNAECDVAKEMCAVMRGQHDAMVERRKKDVAMQVEERERQLAICKEERDGFREDYEASETKYKILLSENKELTTKLDGLSTQLKKLNEDRIMKNNLSDTVQTKNSLLVAENMSIVAINAELALANEQLTSENSALSDKNEILQQELATLRAEKEKYDFLLSTQKEDSDANNDNLAKHNHLMESLDVADGVNHSLKTENQELLVSRLETLETLMRVRTERDRARQELKLSIKKDKENKKLYTTLKQQYEELLRKNKSSCASPALSSQPSHLFASSYSSSRTFGPSTIASIPVDCGEDGADTSQEEDFVDSQIYSSNYSTSNYNNTSQKEPSTHQSPYTTLTIVNSNTPNNYSLPSSSPSANMLPKHVYPYSISPAHQAPAHINTSRNRVSNFTPLASNTDEVIAINRVNSGVIGTRHIITYDKNTDKTSPDLLKSLSSVNTDYGHEENDHPQLSHTLSSTSSTYTITTPTSLPFPAMSASAVSSTSTSSTLNSPQKSRIVRPTNATAITSARVKPNMALPDTNPSTKTNSSSSSGAQPSVHPAVQMWKEKDRMLMRDQTQVKDRMLKEKNLHSNSNSNVSMSMSGQRVITGPLPRQTPCSSLDLDSTANPYPYSHSLTSPSLPLTSSLSTLLSPSLSVYNPKATSALRPLLSSPPPTRVDIPRAPSAPVSHSNFHATVSIDRSSRESLLLTSQALQKEKLTFYRSSNFQTVPNDMMTQMVTNAWTSGDFSLPQKLHDSGFDIASIVFNGTSLLAAAVKHCNIEMVSLLLQSGSDPNLRDKQGMSPLMLACWCLPHLDVIIMLLQCGADINAKDVSGNTPLLFYCGRTKPNIYIIELLLVNGADLHVRDVQGRTALQQNCYSNQPDVHVVKTLLYHGADVNTLDSKGCSPLISFCSRSHASNEVLKLLLSHKANINTMDLNGRNALWITCKFNSKLDANYEMVKILIEHKTDVNCMSNKGLTPLSLAKVEKADKVVDMLLENGAR